MYYWYNTKENICINNAWFDHSSAKNQLLENVKYNENVLFTTFDLNMKEYTIFDTN